MLSVLAALVIQLPIQVLVGWWRIRVEIGDIKARMARLERGLKELERDDAQFLEDLNTVVQEVARIKDLLREKGLKLEECGVTKPDWWDGITDLPLKP